MSRINWNIKPKDFNNHRFLDKQREEERLRKMNKKKRETDGLNFHAVVIDEFHDLDPSNVDMCISEKNLTDI